MFKKFVIVGAIAAACLAAFIGQAGAQTAGGNRGGGGPDGGNGTDGTVVLYGSPGNCPPTIACAPQRPQQPPRKVRIKRSDACGQWIVHWVNGTRIRECRDRRDR